MQGQDLTGALASAALRTADGAIAPVLDALNERRLVRGYPMRGTVFLMPAADVRWITELCAASSLRAARARSPHHGLDDDEIGRARDLAHEALAAGPLSRAEVLARWEEAGIGTAKGRGYHLLFHFIAEAGLVYGPWNGRDQDIAAREQWIPEAPGLQERFDGDRTLAVAELMRRYFTTHGPATLRDFAWWTKLGLTEIRRALPQVAAELESDAADEASYWRPGLRDEAASLQRQASLPYLLPGFDEFILGYQDRLFAMGADHHALLVPGNNGVFKRSVVAGGSVVGTWTRSGSPGKRRLEIDQFVPLSPTRMRRIETLFAEFPWAIA